MGGCSLSVAALVPKAELEGEMGDAHVALQARLMSQALRKISHSLNRSNSMLLFTNQVRARMNSFPAFGGVQETTSGGKALKYYASVRLDVRRTGSVGQKGQLSGNTVRVKVSKNKLAPPFREVDLELVFGRGICPETEALDVGATHGIIQKTGSWYYYNGERMGQGKEKAKAYLKENPSIFAKIQGELRTKLFGESSDPAEAAALHTLNEETEMDGSPEDSTSR
ncbi:hypothetical protein CYMTET_33760 [Cymbomonas tetramitiformis]|uniref:RecA family profile 2 domain-containing protein n=1 Tax=Cymbomonas tetramitiformis TaxID=36881 RepID=A0AAE0FCH3_9CHLO|nr:hypothetical protein CYMTET_33760 [Cymbomonas tetramitiformis]